MALEASRMKVGQSGLNRRSEEWDLDSDREDSREQYVEFVESFKRRKPDVEDIHSAAGLGTQMAGFKRS